MKSIAATCLMCAVYAYPSLTSEPQTVRVRGGPTVLYANLAGQWGGHTFGYLLQGEQGLFWSGRQNPPEGTIPIALIGQEPHLGSSMKAAVTTFRFPDPAARNWNPPQMLRTPDGILHVFIGVDHHSPNPNVGSGRIHYYRSERPEDITTLVDRTELIPRAPFDSFHLRMNVGIAPDGRRMALVILAVSPEGKIPFNTPVLFVGERQGADFVFREPVQYAEPMGLFYPQVAATDDGIVIVGEEWDRQAEKIAFTRLIHLDWDGKLLHREDLPFEGAGQFLSYDLRPLHANDWSRLLLYYNRLPSEHTTAWHEFWEYNVPARRLRQRRALQTEYGRSNSGKWLPISESASLFINNPSMGRFCVWEGDILGEGDVTFAPLPGADPIERGYTASSYLFTPNPLHGSVLRLGEVVIASDCYNPEKHSDKPGPVSFLVWRLQTLP